jgi:hypothetical protein
MAAGEQAFYLVEEVISLASIELFSAFTLGTRGPLELYVEFVTASLPFDVVMSKFADRLGIPMNVDLRESAYWAERTDLVEAEFSIFGDHLTIMPLCLEDTVRLYALYPTEGSDQISTTLMAHQNDFAQIMESRADEVGNIRKSIKSGVRVSVVGKIGEFFGGFVTGLTT